MSNREVLINKLEELKKEADEKTVSVYNEIIAELRNHKKYGLVWDTENTKEDVVLRCEKEIPVLTIDKTKTIDNGGQNNILIEGDNYHALTALNMIAKESVDVIYIDPPYNTGHEDFVYNDKYVGEDDGYRHSKWLSFMQNRLKLIKDLLKETGIVLISIDDREEPQLSMLCSELFGEKNTEKMVWQKIGDGNAAAGKMKTTNRFRIEHEYIIICYKNKNASIFNKYKEVPSFKNAYKNLDNDPRGPFKAGNMSKTEDKSNPNGKNYFTVYSPDGKRSFTRQWNYSEREIKKLIEDNRIYWGKDGHSVPQIKVFVNEARETTPVSILLEKGSASMGSSDLKRIFNSLESPFNNPKPIKLIKHLLSVASKKDAIVLDFFAGSGTTGQAVLELNKEDGGNRKFILCTNNENNICEKITYPRIKTVITGTRIDGSKYSDGLDGSLYYFKTDFINDENNTDQAKYNLVEKVDSLLCIKEDLYIEKHRDNYSSHFTNKEENRHMFIYNDYFSEDKFNRFRELIMNTEGEKTVYMFSFDNTIDEALFEDLNDVTVKPIPSKIYEIYKEIVEDIKRG